MRLGDNSVTGYRLQVAGGFELSQEFGSGRNGSSHRPVTGNLQPATDLDLKHDLPYLVGLRYIPKRLGNF